MGADQEVLPGVEFPLYDKGSNGKRACLGDYDLASVEIYTSPFCPYCHRAKALLKDKGVGFKEVDVLMAPGKRAEMRERADGKNTVPQIFIDGQHIGGCDDLQALDQDGRLDALLQAGT